MNSLKLVGAAALMSLSLAAAPASAAVAVDPTTGGTYSFLWDDLGPIDQIDFGTETEWSVTAPVASTITFSVLDCCITGDVFGFLLNGVATPWDNEGLDGGGYFFASVTVSLAAGVASLFSIDTLVGGGGFPGGGTATFSAATPAVIPLPAGAPLLLLGLGGLALLRRRKTD